MSISWYNLQDTDWYGLSDDAWYYFLTTGNFPNTILPSDYQQLATDIGDFINSVQYATSELTTGIDVILNTRDLYVKIDLVNPFYQVIQKYGYSPTQAYQSAVRTLNQHVISRSGLIDINEYLQVNGITVSSAFASLSAQTGYVIQSEFIVD